MTLVIYEPETPALEFIGHAGAGLYGQDPVCAALSILLYTLAASVPEARASFGDGWARVEGAGEAGRKAGYAFAATGVRLLAEHDPQHVRLEVKS